jgi:hypothetical protein
MAHKTIAIVALLVVIVALVYWRSTRGACSSGFAAHAPSDMGSVLVYGSKTCPWCVKQEDYLKQKGIPYEFTDCTTGQCPDFVSGFPTLVVNGEVKTGYSEI